ncbi:MAG TPA: cytochrome P450 [Alphaproteobacteria bacterium]|nr:cytochrome P450 [Alphaproteobacteria bacterium]
MIALHKKAPRGPRSSGPVRRSATLPDSVLSETYIPPFPPRPAEPLSTLEILRRSRHNFITIWEDKAFQYQTMVTRVLARQVVICNSPDTVQQAFVNANDAFERKSPQMRETLRPLVGDGLFVSDGAIWKTRRRIVAPIIHGQHLPTFAPVMVELAAEMANRWAALPPGSNIDVLGEMAELTAGVICRTIFGPSLSRESARAIIDGFSQYQRQIDVVNLLSFAGFPDIPNLFSGLRVRRHVRKIVNALDTVIAGARARHEQDENSLVGMLLNAKDTDGKQLSHDAVRNEAAVIFMAGHETTANTLAWAWFLLSQAGWAADKLHEELDRVLGGRAPNLKDVPDLIYTRAVIDETLRLYPPIPLLTRQASRPEKIRSRQVEKGAIVAVIPWLLHRHRLYWDKPDHFMPERFLPGAPPIDRYTYVPFSIGPRVCAGLQFGLTEAVLCLATLAQSFRLDLAPGAKVEPVSRLSLRPGETLPMLLYPRAPLPRPIPAAVADATPAAGSCPFGHG